MKSSMSIIRILVMAVAIACALAYVNRLKRTAAKQEHPVNEETWSELDLILPRAIRGDHDPLGDRRSISAEATELKNEQDPEVITEMAPFIVKDGTDDLELELSPLDLPLTLPEDATEAEYTIELLTE